MSETERRRKHYKKRVLIDTDRVLNPVFGDSLLCITGAQLEMLRNLTQYLHRESTFVSEYEDGSYLVPSNEEWDQLQAIVAELEETLMGCEDIVAKLACICDALRQLRTSDGIPPDSALPDQTSYDTYRSPVIEDEGDPPTGWETWPEWKVAKCKGAQKIMDDVIAWMEKLIVWSGAGTTLTFIALESALVATTIVPPIAIVMAIASLIAVIGLSLIQQAAQDWIAEHKQCLVCAIFNADTAALARFELETYIDAEWDIAGSPAVFLHLLNYATLSRIFDGTLPGYADWKAEYSAAYCAICADAITGSDWYAIALDPLANKITLDHPDGAYWEPGCLQMTVPGGETCVGIVFEVQNQTGDCNLRQVIDVEPPRCVGLTLWSLGCENMQNGIYFAIDPDTIDEEECKATLCPTATNCPSDPAQYMFRRDGPLDVFGAVELGWACTGYAEIVVLYQVFEGVAPCQ